VYFSIAHHDGYCAGCHDERPLVVIEHGPRGLRAWLAGVGAEDRELSYSCLLCGRTEHVPLTEAEDVEYDATLATWPDWMPSVEPVVPEHVAPVAVVPEPVPVTVVLPDTGPVVALPAAARKPLVRIMTLPTPRVEATDDQLLSLRVA
jgi:hypothetical protein